MTMSSSQSRRLLVTGGGGGGAPETSPPKLSASKVCCFLSLFFSPLSLELIGYSPATAYANLIIRARETKNEIVMKYVMFGAKRLPRLR